VCGVCRYSSIIGSVSKSVKRCAYVPPSLMMRCVRKRESTWEVRERGSACARAIILSRTDGERDREGDVKEGVREGGREGGGE
jgi:hypothetical protein